VALWACDFAAPALDSPVPIPTNNWVYQPFNQSPRFATSHLQLCQFTVTYFSASTFLFAFLCPHPTFLAKYIPSPRLHQASNLFSGEQFAFWGTSDRRSKITIPQASDDTTEISAFRAENGALNPPSTVRTQRRNTTHEMSFGASSSDVVVVVAFCRALHRRCRDAGAEYDEIRDEVRGMQYSWSSHFLSASEFEIPPSEWCLVSGSMCEIEYRND